ncbi:MAG TPA: PAAR-like protein, partial [Hymenobacter sp.]|nr:PAAR-like protein [Hymenobacter sp.]
MKKHFVISGAQLKCDQTIAPTPGAFIALNPLWNIQGRGVGRITDFIPFFNVMFFGVPCKMLTQAAAGVPTPCVPFPTPWQGTHDSGRGTMLPVLLDSSSCRCVFGGGISVSNAGQSIAGYDGPVAPEPPASPLPGNIIVYRPADQQPAANQQAHTQQLAAAETQLNSPATLPPNTLFLVNNYLYVTDDHGKVVQ